MGDDVHEISKSLSGGVIEKIDREKQLWVKDALGIVKSSIEGKIFIKSGMQTDTGDWEQAYTRRTIDETIKELAEVEN